MSTGQDWLAERFEENRTLLREVGYRLLGSRSDAEDAVQDTWLRLSRSDADAIRNLSAWLTTVMSRICLDRLRARAAHPEHLGGGVPGLLLTADVGAIPGADDGHQANGLTDPADEAVLADSVGLALVVVLETLSPDERVSLVLHDMFGLPFDRIAQLLDTSPGAARQLASRARRRVRDAEPDEPAAAPQAQRTVVDAFFAAARNGDFDALLDLLHPDVVLRADGGNRRATASAIIRGRDDVAGRATMFDRPGASLQHVLANGLPAVIVTQDGRPVSVMVFTVVGGTSTGARIGQVDVLLDPVRLARLDRTALAALGQTELPQTRLAPITV